ncbi:hypothetical protein KSU1_B0334 [Candidatus Jettenia caeni]|uniref:Uncharacterized protein n=2 Tax=Candidatus Jettenia TaxID=360731 RepID=I3IHJ6_9BACT|nr:MAG: hypothetical protein EDM77_16010 [Candidatus Jettenia sp. AMX1]MCQ3928650.1 hypothetical protein [Candidatus Jettenia sp.]GAB61191.1 hypothetical protein KSU1_B0334 [Candidatus Jettenia caeni]
MFFMMSIILGLLGFVFLASLFAMFQLNKLREEEEGVLFEKYQSRESVQYDINDILEMMELAEYSLA